MTRTVDFYDFDGTLADTVADIAEAYRRTLEKLGLPATGFAEKFRIGPPLVDTIRMVLPDATPEQIAEVATAFRPFYDDSGFPASRLYDGIREALDRRLRAGARLFVLTNKRRVPTLAMLEKFGIADRFEGVHTSDEPGGPWPKGKLLCDLLKRYRLAPGACRMIGDMASDVAAAREAGVEAVGVAWGYGTAAELAAADAVLATPAEL